MGRIALVALVASSLLFGVHAWRPRTDEMTARQPAQGAALERLMSSAHIVPASPFANNTLRINLEGATAADYEAIAVTWFRNGQEIVGYAAVELTPEYYQKGDQLEADVRVREPQLGEAVEAVATNVVFVSNTPPRIVESSVDVARNGSDYLFATVNAVDADNDALEFSYTWYQNGDEVSDAYGETFDLSRCRSGDQVHALVIAWDGEVESAVSHSKPFEVGSSAPVITSTPPQSIVDRSFLYKIDTVAVDPLGLSFELLKAPEGMTVSEHGVIVWSMPEVREGQHQYDVVVRVTSADGGKAYQDFSISVEGAR